MGLIPRLFMILNVNPSINQENQNNKRKIVWAYTKKTK